MLTTLLACLLMQSPPGPLDGFRVNFASIKAELDFVFEVGEFQGNEWIPWSEPLPRFVETRPDDRIIGHWACDGHVEYYLFSSPHDVLERAQRDELKTENGKVFYKVHFVPKTELLWDGELLCWHSDHPHLFRRGGDPNWKSISTERAGPSFRFAGLVGPFSWGFGPFPHTLGTYGAVVPERHQVTKFGRPLEVEIYRHSSGAAKWMQLEVYYDFSVGFLPRLVRALSYDYQGDVAYVMEFMLKDARPCAAGGFIPCEWFNRYYKVNQFGQRFPNYRYGDDINKVPARKGFAHYMADGLKSLTGPVALKEVRQVEAIGGIGGIVRIDQRRASLTLDDMRAILGRKLWMPTTAQLPNMRYDIEEAHQFDRTPTRFPLTFYTTGGLVLGCCCLFMWVIAKRRRNGKVWGILGLAATLACSGCGGMRRPVVKLSGFYEKQVVYIEPRGPGPEAALVLRNDGNVPVRIENVDGGCACRRVDQSALPIVVNPGGVFALRVAMSVPRITGPQGSAFDIDTDRGRFRVEANFLILLGHDFEPRYVANTQVIDEDSWNFTFRHRAVFDTEGRKSDYKLRFPKGFRVTKVRSEGAPIASAPHYQYEDTTYRLRLENPSLGDHREVIGLVDPDGAVVEEVPVLWKRLPYLSSTPERVILGSQPVRVLLRCRDETVELSKVLSTPPGVEASISSRREIIVCLGRSPAAVLDGWVEVGTTAASKPPLRFQIVRYAPQVGRRAGVIGTAR